MPIKAHVKGKRKAPPPPITVDAIQSNEKSTINQCEHKCSNHKTGIAPDTMTCVPNQKRKKPAPLPPSAAVVTCVKKEAHASNDEMNNLSAISKRVSGKSAVKAINLNIFEPNHIRNDLQCLTKENNEVNVNLDSNGKHDLFHGDIRRNDQIWICNHCTLQNPFWKIICEACEKIKPYNTPTLPNANIPFAMDVNRDSARVNEKNQMISVVMRPKPHKPKNDTDKMLNRNSMYVDVKNAMSSKELPNKRNSLGLIKYGDQNISPEALEMEKERIRSVIRAMNNRALAQKYPGNGEKKFDEMKIEMPTKTATINKPGKRNSILKYDCEKDYNLPSIRRNSGESSTKEIDFKWNPNGIKPIRKIENADNVVKCNELSRDIRTYCDQMSLANMRKKYDCDANANGKREIPFTASNNSIKMDMENEISLNLYINFNNSIEVKANREMTLDQFKMRIFEKMIPSRNPKIYFNGLLLRDDDQSLDKYGITNQSSLYINTENVVVQAHAKNEKISVIVQAEKPGPSNYGVTTDKNEPTIPEKSAEKAEKFENREEKKVEKKVEKASKSLFDDAITKNDDGEKFLIEHIQLNRITIERVPSNANISKVKYRGVYNYNPRCNPEITKILNNKPANPVRKPLSKEALACLKNAAEKLKPILKVDKSEPITQYIELLSLDDSMDLTKNTEIFECTVCLVEYQPFEGVILRNCLHTFCKDCVRNTINYSDEAEVKCPYMDESYSCDCLLQDREIKAILSKTEYDDHLAKSLRIAENQIENSFHCKTPDCKGWCIYEDDVNTFKCPICRLENCLTCRVIHDGLNCKQYQNVMKNSSDKNPENATTHAMLEEMIKSGDAMNCPACKIVLMKKWGCDWLKCSMCKTEICWITRGYRWGPGGKGDTSAGCKCGVDGFRCHPKCNYCH